MSIKPILFNTEMVRAILAGKKTQTRRVVKGLDGLNVYRAEPCEDAYETLGEWDFFYGWSENGCMFDAVVSAKAPCSIGDIMWVRETWNYVPESEHDGFYVYAADMKPPADRSDWKWHPSIHMPRAAARIFLRVKDVRVERLQDIDDDGVVAEGLEIGAQFDELWNRTVKNSDRSKLGWNANPWVWVITFERCERPSGWWEVL